MKLFFSQVALYLRNIAFTFVFPSFCLSCKSSIKTGKTPLCKECFAHLALLDPIGRCPQCFGDLEESRFCLSCSKNKHASTTYAHCFEPVGPVITLVSAFCNKDMAALSSALSAFLFLQIDNLGWPYPDIITYVPQTYCEACATWYNPGKLLAKKLAKLLKRPCNTLVKKEYPNLQQPRFSPLYHQLAHYEGGITKERAKTKVLLVDAKKSQETLLCSEALLETYGSLYILSLC